jgi:iron complex transport system substrate-binding protein
LLTHGHLLTTSSPSAKATTARFDSSLAQIYHPRVMGQRGILVIGDWCVTRAEHMIQKMTPISPLGIRHSGLVIDSGIRVSSFFLAVFLALLIGCGKQSKFVLTTQPTAPTIASLVPSATDLIVGMGATDRLVAVSVYDSKRPDVGHLPKAGDYQTVDWELLASLHPSLLCTAISSDRQTQGFKDHAAALAITPLDMKVDRLVDIDTALDRLGDALKLSDRSNIAKAQIHARLDAVRKQVGNQPVIPVLIVTDAAAEAVVGPDNYLDDLLKLSGGSNAAALLHVAYPSIDREMLLHLAPQVIIQLLPDASPQEKDQAAAVWRSLPQIPAVAEGRVYPIYEEYALLPGWHVTDLAEKFAQCIHPENPASTSTMPAR